MTLAFFDDSLERTYSYRLPGVQTRRRAYPFPDHKVTVLGSSKYDDAEGQIIVHNSALRESTKGVTEHMRLGHVYLAERMFLSMGIRNLDEQRLLKLRISELKLCADFMLRIGKIERETQYKEIFSLLRLIERDLGDPKRDKRKLRASQDVSTALNYRSPKGKQPVGPVAAMSARGAIAQIEARIRNLLGIGAFADLHHALFKQHIRDGEAVFRTIKDAKNVDDLREPVSKLVRLKVNPFLRPARRILDAYENLNSDRGLLQVAHTEAHGSLLLGYVERRVIRRLSDIQHERVSGAELSITVERTIALSKALESRLVACDAFTKDVRELAVTRLRTARNILSQEDLFSSERRRAISAKRALTDLTGLVAA
ncbi:hypothetical protein IT407_02620 [Candidatus Uhrbacteria bacterium]|nr:hypothetical protein [Candidatus Uhrbacteria bacterium]